MADDHEIPTLLVYLFGDGAGQVERTAGERLLRWSRAFDDWLAEVQQEHTDRTWCSVRRAWQRFLGHSKKLPWEITPVDMQAFIASLEAGGLKPSSINRFITDLSKFYRWSASHGIDPETGPAFNPALSVRRPEHRRYAGVRLLSEQQVEALLDLLSRDRTPIGARNYAFILARLELGVPSSWIKDLKWGQLDPDETGAWVTWQPGEEPERLPYYVWAAIQAYLEISGRIDGLLAEPVIPASSGPFARDSGGAKDEYIFPPLKPPSSEGKGYSARDWEAGRSISRKIIQNQVRRCGRLLGIPDEKLALHNLRLTATRLKLDSGPTLEEMHAFLHSRDSLNGMQRRLKALPELPLDEISAPAGGLLPHPPDHTVRPLSGKEQFSHGFYASRQPPGEVDAMLSRLKPEDLLRAAWLEEVVDQMQALSQRVMEMAERAGNPIEQATLLDAGTFLILRSTDIAGNQETLSKETGDDKWVVEFKAMLEEFAPDWGDPPGKWTRIIEEGAIKLRHTSPEQMARAIASLRVTLDRLYEMALRSESARELAKLANYYGRSGGRLIRLLKASRSQGNPEAAAIRCLIDESLEAFTADLLKLWDAQDHGTPEEIALADQELSKWGV